MVYAPNDPAGFTGTIKYDHLVAAKSYGGGLVAAASDTTPPTVSISAPLGGATVSNTVTVSAAAADNVGVVGVQFKLDGANLGAEDLVAPYSVSWNTTTVPNGAHTLKASARDAAGNATTSASISVIVANADATPPTVAITAPTSNPTFSTSTTPLTLGGTASDNVGVTQVTWVNSAGGSGTATGTTSWTASGIVLQPGANGLTVTATDAAGNTATDTLTVTFTPTFALTVSKGGTGTGTVTSAPAGITCGATCAASFASGTAVTLTAAPAAGSTFGGWSGGGCSGTGTCVVTLSAATTVTATFTLPTFTLTVSKAGAGNGTVTSTPTGINCGPNCSNIYASGTAVTLTATAKVNSTFTGWSGAGCTGTGACTVTVSAATTVTATFTPQTFTLTVSKTGTGSGTITSSPTGITCGATCSASFPSGTAVTLTAAPAAGSIFSGWSGGGCSGTGA